MKDFSFKSIAPHLLAVVLFVAITMLYFSPLLEGKQIKQSDNLQFQGASKEIADYRATTGKEALWTNRMFGGMPAYQISVSYASNLVKYIDKIFHLWLPHPAGLVFLYFIGFYILLLVLRIDPRLSMIGAIGFGFSSFFLVILSVGHNTQAMAIGYMAPVIAGIILCFRGKYVLGGILTALFMALELNSNHVQITYYLMLALVILGIAEFIGKFREKKLKAFLQSVAIIGAAMIIALGANISNLWATYEYGKNSTRSKSELTSDIADKTNGLDRSYVTAYSYGKMESFTLLIPNFMGGSSSGELSKSSATYAALKEHNIQNPEKIIKGLPLYWGPQGSTEAPVYAGAIMCFLFILGIFIVKGKYKWWLLGVTVLSLFLAWGKNLMWFTNFFLDYVPAYDKFRAVSMTLVLAEICIPLLGLLALKYMFNNDVAKEVKIKALKFAGGITLGVIVIFGFLGGSFFNFVSASDADMISSGYPDWLVTAIQSDRPGLLMADSFRSFALIALTVAVLWLFTINKLKNRNVVFLIIGVLVLFDMWAIDKRYMNSENFVSKSKMSAVFAKSKSDEAILADNTKDYRVLNLINPFNDGMTSYYHNSIGGYHGAKLKRYQELIENRLSDEISAIKSAFSAKSIDSALTMTLKKVSVLNMLNTKYLIYNPEANPLTNPHALGNAWFVDNYKLVANADSEIAALKNFDPSVTAIIDKRFESQVNSYKNSKDSAATIKLVTYSPNDLVYESKASKDQLAVFSEIYYSEGWDPYIDGKITPYFRTNYVLRGMIVPSGTHKIEWKFEPKVYYTGEKISLAFNILLLLVVAGGIFYEIRTSRKNKIAEEEQE